jgi:hypothetical protein
MKALPSEDLLFASDDAGNVTHLRGVQLPGLLFHTFAAASLSERAPIKDTTWVVRGMYKFARRVQEEPTEVERTGDAKS